MTESLLPPNATAAEKALDLSTARVGAVPVPVAALWNADTCPAELLPWLAWALGVEDWDGGWPEAAKRGAIRKALGLRRLRGTVGSLRRALDGIGLAGYQIVELYTLTVEDPAAPRPYTFEVRYADVGNETLSDAQITARMARVQPVRSRGLAVRYWGATVQGFGRNFGAAPFGS